MQYSYCSFVSHCLCNAIDALHSSFHFAISSNNNKQQQQSDNILTILYHLVDSLQYSQYLQTESAAFSNSNKHLHEKIELNGLMLRMAAAWLYSSEWPIYIRLAYGAKTSTGISLIIQYLTQLDLLHESHSSQTARTTNHQLFAQSLSV